MIHKIKALYNKGNGLSQRQIAKELGISRNSVKKYLSMEAQAISEHLEETERTKRLDEYREYIGVPDANRRNFRTVFSHVSTTLI